LTAEYVGRDASSFGAVVITAHEFAERDAERCCEWRELSLVDGLAGLESPERPGKDAGSLGEVINAEAACDAKAQEPRRQELYRRDSANPVGLSAGWARRMLDHHRFALMHQNAASSA
jgi:hypothetical protein